MKYTKNIYFRRKTKSKHTFSKKSNFSKMFVPAKAKHNSERYADKREGDMYIIYMNIYDINDINYI